MCGGVAYAVEGISIARNLYTSNANSILADTYLAALCHCTDCQKVTYNTDIPMNLNIISNAK